MKFKSILFILLLPAFNLCAQEDSTASREDNDTATTPALTRKEARSIRKAEQMYHIKKAIDYPIILALGGTSIYMLTVIYSKSPTPESTILALNKNDLWSFDRPATNNHDLNLDRISYYPFYAVMPLPLILLADKEIAKDKGTIGVLYLESFAFEGIMYTSAAYFVDRFRPDVYNTSLSMSYRTDGNYRNSFFAGHVAVVADATFFIAKVYNDYHPGSGARWWLYGAATAATLGMGYIRYEAGKHFPSDIAAGAVVGVACGLLTPQFHKNRDLKKQRWTVVPSLLDNSKGGFTFTYKL